MGLVRRQQAGDRYFLGDLAVERPAATAGHWERGLHECVDEQGWAYDSQFPAPVEVVDPRLPQRLLGIGRDAIGNNDQRHVPRCTPGQKLALRGSDYRLDLNLESLASSLDHRVNTHLAGRWFARQEVGYDADAPQSLR